MVYARNLGGRELTFDFGAGLLQDNLLIVDRETRSVWSQLAGKAVSGPMKDTPLQALPSLQTTWAYWRNAHPDTRVAVYEGTRGRPYLYRDPDRRARDRKPRGTPGHDTSALGLGLVAGGEAWLFPLDELDRLPRNELPLVRRIGGQEVRIHYEPEGLTAWAESAAGERLVTVIAYASGWRRFYPDTRVFQAGG